MNDIHFKVTKKHIIATTWLSNGDWLWMRFLKTKNPDGYLGTEYWVNLYVGPKLKYLFSTQSKAYGRGGRSMFEGWKMAQEIIKIVHRDYMDYGDWIAMKGSDKRRDDIYFKKLLGTHVSDECDDHWRLTNSYNITPNVFILYKNYLPEHLDPNGIDGRLQFDYYPWDDPNVFDRQCPNNEYEGYYYNTPVILILLDDIWFPIKEGFIWIYGMIRDRVHYLLQIARSHLPRIVMKGKPRKSRRERNK